MRLYVDEDIASAELLARLTAAGHEVLAPLRGEPDARCWRYAQEHAAAVITMDAVDFVALAEASASHHGLILGYRRNDPTRDLTIASIAQAIGRVTEVYPDGIADQILVLNQFQW